MKCPWCGLEWNDPGHTPVVCVEKMESEIRRLKEQISILEQSLEELGY